MEWASSLRRVSEHYELGCYLTEIIPTKALKTQENDISRLKKLQAFFRDEVSIDLGCVDNQARVCGQSS
jgi:hypothetical protein